MLTSVPVMQTTTVVLFLWRQAILQKERVEMLFLLLVLDPLGQAN